MKRNNDPIYFKTLMYFMIVATVALSVAITIAKLDPNEFYGDFYWSRSDHQLEESGYIQREDGAVEVWYNNNDKPYYRAIFKEGEECAVQLGVDMDQDGTMDFTVMDGDNDGALDFDLIFCHENCDDVMRRAKMLFEGKLILEKSI